MGWTSWTRWPREVGGASGVSGSIGTFQRRRSPGCRRHSSRRSLQRHRSRVETPNRPRATRTAPLRAPPRQSRNRRTRQLRRRSPQPSQAHRHLLRRKVERPGARALARVAAATAGNGSPGPRKRSSSGQRLRRTRRSYASSPPTSGRFGKPRGRYPPTMWRRSCSGSRRTPAGTGRRSPTRQVRAPLMAAPRAAPPAGSRPPPDCRG